MSSQNYILRGNLEDVFKCAIQYQMNREDSFTEELESAYLAGIKYNLKQLQEGKPLIIKYDE